MRNVRSRIRGVVAGSALTLVAGGMVTTGAAASAVSEAAGPDWQPCADAPGFECADVKVPLNHKRPQGRQIRLAVTRLPATGDKIGSLFFNPGGPGGPGVAALQQMSAFFPAELRERFDLVSWDPRGVG